MVAAAKSSFLDTPHHKDNPAWRRGRAAKRNRRGCRDISGSSCRRVHDWLRLRLVL